MPDAPASAQIAGGRKREAVVTTPDAQTNPRGALMGGEKVIDPQAAGYVEHRNHYIMVSHFHEHLKKFGPPARAPGGVSTST